MPRELSPVLTALRVLPDRIFFQGGKLAPDAKPNYNRAFAEICREVYAGSLKSASDLIIAIGEGERLNLSSWQRMVAKESERRKLVFDKPAKAKAAAIKKISRARK